MSRKNQLEKCLKIIEYFFDAIERKAFTEYKLKEIIRENKYNWKLPERKSTKQVILYLRQREVFFSNAFINPLNENIIIYSWKTQDEFTVINGLKSNSYFTHFSAMYLHQLSLQIPKTVYLNFEHNSIFMSKGSDNALTQETIDNAFKKGQRKSLLSFSYSDKKIILTNGMYTNNIGVIKTINEVQSFYYTDLERTLIDISVRPVYAGGVFEVLEAYKIAKGKLNVKKMADYFNQMNFIYPYHQVIGFYLEKAGYNKKEVACFNKSKIFNFYLTYDMRNKEFDEKWRLYYPKGF